MCGAGPESIGERDGKWWATCSCACTACVVLVYVVFMAFFRYLCYGRTHLQVTAFLHVCGLVWVGMRVSCVHVVKKLLCV